MTITLTDLSIYVFALGVLVITPGPVVVALIFRPSHFWPDSSASCRGR